MTRIQTSLINRTYASEDLGDSRDVLIQTHGIAIMRALLIGFAGSAPKSTVANLGDLFAILVSKYPAESKVWMTQILNGVSGTSYLRENCVERLPIKRDFADSKAGPEAKDTFIKAVYACALFSALIRSVLLTHW
jgi:hypothetical protein